MDPDDQMLGLVLYVTIDHEKYRDIKYIFLFRFSPLIILCACELCFLWGLAASSVMHIKNVSRP